MSEKEKEEKRERNKRCWKKKGKFLFSGALRRRMPQGGRKSATKGKFVQRTERDFRLRLSATHAKALKASFACEKEKRIRSLEKEKRSSRRAPSPPPSPLRKEEEEGRKVSPSSTAKPNEKGC